MQVLDLGVPGHAALLVYAWSSHAGMATAPCREGSRSDTALSATKHKSVAVAGHM